MFGGVKWIGEGAGDDDQCEIIEKERKKTGARRQPNTGKEEV